MSIWLIVLVVYLLGMAVTAPKATRAVGAERVETAHVNPMRCPSVNSAHYCRRHHNNNGETAITNGDAFFGLVASLAWPFLAVLTAVKLAANPEPRLTRVQRREVRQVRQRVAPDAAIAKAEAEAGIR